MSAPPSPAAPGSGLALGPWRVGEELGRGGMGVVYEATHEVLGIPAAVKVVTARRALDPEFAAAFRREVRATAALHHPHVIAVHDLGTIDEAATQRFGGRLLAGSPYLVMELAGGGSLSELLVDSLDWEQQRRILLQLLDALGHAHARGLVHRDIKAGNVLLDAVGDVRLADFGLAQAAEERTDAGSTEMASGTALYMAPEQLAGHWRDYGAWTDLYAVGVLAWRMASGGFPFAGDNVYAIAFAHAQGRRQPFSPTSEVPVGFQEWLEQLLAPAPGERYQRAADAAWALAGLEGLDLRRARAPASRIDAEAPPTVVESRPASAADLSAQTLLQPAPALVVPPPTADRARRASLTPMAATWRSDEQERREALPLPGAGLGLFGVREVPLVGRGPERDLLWAALLEAERQGECRVALLRGGPGSGKSHLARWFAQRAEELGAATALTARHGPTTSPDHGVGPMMSRWLRCQGLGPQEASQRVGQLLGGAGCDDPWLARGLAALVSPSAESTGPDPAEQRRLLRAALDALRGDRPLILWLDDLQWGDDALTFARYLTQARPPIPAVVVGTVRDDLLTERPGAARSLALLEALPAARSMQLGPLQDGEQRDLLARLVGLSDELLDELTRRTEGSPMLALQLLGDWIDRGALQAGARGFTLAGVELHGLQDRIQDLWRARVARALAGQGGGADLQLAIGAVLGTTVENREWRAACAAAGVPGPDATLERLVGAGLARAQRDTWAFGHGLLRATILRTAEEAGRLAIAHEAAAAAVEARWPRGQPGRAERLGEHLRVAGRLDRAIDLLLVGVEEAAARSEYERANRILERVDEALEAGTGTADPRRGAASLLRCAVLRHQNRLDEAQLLLEELLPEAERLGWPLVAAEATTTLGDVIHHVGDVAAAEPLVHAGLARHRQLGDDEGALHARRILASLHRIAGRYDEAAELLAGVIQGQREQGARHKLANALRDLAILEVARGRPERAVELCEEAASIYEAIGMRMGLVRTLNTLGTALAEQGRLQDALARFEEGRQLDAIVQCGLGPMLWMNTGLVAARAGDIEAAERACAEVNAAVSGRHRDSFLPYLQSVQLVIAAARGLSVASLAGALAETTRGHADADVARMAELAAQRSGDADCRALAIRLWDEAGRPEEAERLRSA